MKMPEPKPISGCDICRTMNEGELCPVCDAAQAGVAQDVPLRFSPADGVELTDCNWSAIYYRSFNTVTWHCNPWTGQPRTEADIAADPFGLLIEPPSDAEIKPNAWHKPGLKDISTPVHGKEGVYWNCCIRCEAEFEGPKNAPHCEKCKASHAATVKQSLTPPTEDAGTVAGELLPCPHCGLHKSAVLLPSEEIYGHPTGSGHYAVICDFGKLGCGAVGGVGLTRAGAIRQWNTRPLASTAKGLGDTLVPSASLTVWYGPMPESNGKSNFTAILMRKGGDIVDGWTIDRSEYPDRVRYEADRVRWLIGELAERPDILAYDADKHSGYVALADCVAVKRKTLEAIVEEKTCPHGGGRLPEYHNAKAEIKAALSQSTGAGNG